MTDRRTCLTCREFQECDSVGVEPCTGWRPADRPGLLQRLDLVAGMELKDQREGTP